MIPFDAEFAARSAQEFIDDVLVGALGATHVSVGENFRFGHKAQGDPQLLAADERFETRVVRCWRSTARSSPRATSAGSCSAARSTYADRLLGDPFQLRGEVVHGDERGRELGYPTANLVPDDALVLPRPRRLRRACADGRAGRAVSIGVRPTFVTGRGELIEAYLLDFDGDLYGSELRLEFLERLRGEKRFDTRRGAGRADGPRRRAHARDRRRGLSARGASATVCASHAH